METFEAIEKRRSIRQFTKEPVEWEKVGNLLRAGILAPTAGDVQDVRFVVITDSEKIKAVANASMDQKWITQAPIVIIVYSEVKHAKRFYGLRGERFYTVQNSAAAIQNILLAATDQGLASCWVGAFNESELNEIIGAPKGARPQAIIPVGYSDKEHKMPAKNKLVDVTFLNGWSGKVTNVDLLFDDFSQVVKNKIIEGKQIALAQGKGLVSKGKDRLKEMHKKVRNIISK